ncbi:MAG: AmmeMemoRadiSam system radical SAM enzyme [Candidatus Ranarchaeia archaeon]|jgi:pyruvate formate lyase activating enzyme
MPTIAFEGCFYTQVGQHKKVRCTLCPHNCLISIGEGGLCGVRVNQNGVLKSTNYGLVSSQSVEPIESTLLNFNPGSLSLALGSVGCNLACKGCQNWQVSQSIKGGNQVPHTTHVPEQVLNSAKKFKCSSVVFKYNEPFVWYEFVDAVGNLCKKENINLVLFSNGFVNQEALEKLLPKLSAVNLDLKFFSEKKYSEHCGTKALKFILENTIALKDAGVHLEITNLLVPEENTALSTIREMCEWIMTNLGDTTPLHFAAFMPDHKLKTLNPASTQMLTSARDLAMKIGLKYVYTRNIDGLTGENTFCPACKERVIQRIGSTIVSTDVTENNECSVCGTKLAIRGKVEKKSPLWL